jgi:hypothetical protein
VNSSHDHVIEVPVIDVHGGTFVFYIYNQSEYFVNVLEPDSATVELPHQAARQKIHLKHTSAYGPRTLFLNPKRG